jgi:hypothetical protein
MTKSTQKIFLRYSPLLLPCDRKFKKKIETAVINALQLETRKNLIQMSSDVITIVTVIINYELLKFAIKICSL